jgi:hypothetical protein
MHPKSVIFAKKAKKRAIPQASCLGERRELVSALARLFRPSGLRMAGDGAL